MRGRGSLRLNLRRRHRFEVPIAAPGGSAATAVAAGLGGSLTVLAQDSSWAAPMPGSIDGQCATPDPPASASTRPPHRGSALWAIGSAAIVGGVILLALPARRATPATALRRTLGGYRWAVALRRRKALFAGGQTVVHRFRFVSAPPSDRRSVPSPQGGRCRMHCRIRLCGALQSGPLRLSARAHRPNGSHPSHRARAAAPVSARAIQPGSDRSVHAAAAVPRTGRGLPG